MGKVSICGGNQSLPKGPGRFWISNTEMRKNILFTTKCAKKVVLNRVREGHGPLAPSLDPLLNAVSILYIVIIISS